MNGRLISVFLIGLWGLVFNGAMAQSGLVIRGRITDASLNGPVPFASVYINESTRGTTADAEGYFQLTGVPVGTVEVVISSLGFKTVRHTVRLSNAPGRNLNVALMPETQALQAVTVKAKRSKAYDRWVRVFERELLGNTPFADRCQINNIETVTLTNQDGRLEAHAPGPLVIDNLALGYRLYYNLLHFDSFRQATHYAGTSRFEELKPENAEQAQRWERNRQKAYEGSLRHLLASLIAGTYEREGFLVYKANFELPADPSVPLLQRAGAAPVTSVQPDSLFKSTLLASERQLQSARPLEVFYTRQRSLSTPYKEMPYAYSVVYVPKGRAATVTTDGWVAQPNGLEVRGAMSDDRLSTLLPTDWKPTAPETRLLAAQPDEGTVLPADTIVGQLASQWTKQQVNSAPAVFVHLDKGDYTTGDTLWFSGYVLHPTTHEPVMNIPSDVDHTLHLELAAPDGRLIKHQWARVRDGRTSGWFRLSDSLATGVYRLRAYSESDSANARPAFERRVSVVNALAPGNDLKSLAVDEDSIDVQFLPEGGHWVAGLPSRLGIKAIDKQGRGVPVTGRIVAGSGAEVGQFKTNSTGIGSLEMVPQVSQAYRVRITTGTGTPVTVALPAVDEKGLALAVDGVTDSTQLIVQVQASATLVQQPVYLRVQSRGQLAQQTKLQLLNGKARLTIPMAKLPVGLAQVTLFNAEGVAQQERLVFVPDRQLPVQAKVETNKPTYQPRESVLVSLRIADGFDEPLTMIGSASVTDVSQLPADTVVADIRTHLLLTGELRGRLEGANAYLNGQGYAGRRALDDLLLTQGWRRLSWRSANSQPAAANGTDQGQIVRGRVVDKNNKEVANANVLLTFTSLNGDAFARSARTNARGQFFVNDLSLKDTVRVGYQIMTTTFKPLATARVLMEGPGGYFTGGDAPEALPSTHWQPFLVASQQRQAGAPDHYRDQPVHQLKEVTVRASTSVRERSVGRQNLYDKADATVLFDERSRAYTNVYEMLQGQVSGVQVSAKSDGNGYNVVVRGIASLNVGEPNNPNSPVYIVDGTYIKDETGSALLMLDPNQIERIDVIKNSGAAIYGARAATGVIAFYSKKGKIGPRNRHEAEQLINGYPSEREFYTPKYGNLSESTVNAPDYRDVLYWRPLLATDGRGLTSFRFPLSDNAHVVRITVQGVTLDGRPVSISKLVKVQ